MKQILLRQHQPGGSLAARDRVDDAFGASDPEAPPAEFPGHDERLEPDVAQSLDVGERESRRAVIFGGGLGEFRSKGGDRDVDVVLGGVEYHFFSPATIVDVKIGLTMSDAANRILISPDRR